MDIFNDSLVNNYVSDEIKQKYLEQAPLDWFITYRDATLIGGPSNINTKYIFSIYDKSTNKKERYYLLPFKQETFDVFFAKSQITLLDKFRMLIKNALNEKENN